MSKIIQDDLLFEQTTCGNYLCQIETRLGWIFIKWTGLHYGHTNLYEVRYPTESNVFLNQTADLIYEYITLVSNEIREGGVI